jgi:hypothetical protein
MSDDECALERALEAVLIKYRIPAHLDDYNADRGDLSSDLATAARTYFASRIDGSTP